MSKPQLFQLALDAKPLFYAAIITGGGAAIGWRTGLKVDDIFQTAVKDTYLYIMTEIDEHHRNKVPP